MRLVKLEYGRVDEVSYWVDLCNVLDLASLGNADNVCVGSIVYNI